MTITVRAGGLRGYEALMRKLGADPASMLRRYRIAPESLQDDDTLLPLHSVVRMLEASAVSTQCPDFGLQLAEAQDISVLGPVAIAMQNAPTVASAMATASRYLFVHSRGMSLTVHPHSPLLKDAVEVRFELQMPGNNPLRQTMDVCLADVYRMLELLTGHRSGLLAVALSHAPLAPLSVYRRFFGAPVYTQQAYSGLHVARANFEQKLQGMNQLTRKIAVDYLAANFSDPEQTVAARVRQALQRSLGTPESGKPSIAAFLGMHPRTMQRHLASENTRFEVLSEVVKKEMAHRYLCETRIPLSQLSTLLGYAEQSVFVRSSGAMHQD
jgi:AraC-like DNA-binding protein